MRLPKRALAWLALRLMGSEGRPELAFEWAICVSQAVKDILVRGGLPLAQAQVIHGGSDVARFPNGAKPAAPDTTLRLLYAGQLVPHKGVHTAIEALARLATKPNGVPVTLTIVGTGHPEYEASLHRLVDQHNLRDNVVFHGGVPRAEMPSLLRQFDVLVFPSTYEEPLARMTQEAMLSGLLVIGTTTGGSKELLVHGANSLTFAAEDSEGLADQIALAAGDRVLRERLAAAGRQTVAEKFNLDRMVDEIEAYLEQVVRQPVTAGPAVETK
jgi:glycosyltransferase involved in cell wall biosynthesis